MPLANSKVRVRVPATTANLGPGFDCLGMALEIYNEVEFEALDAPGLKIDVSGAACCDQMARDEQNLVYRAASRVFDLAGCRPAGLSMRLVVNAPLARGLGSSASAIVGGMSAANALLGNALGERELLREMVAMEKHPDNVAACYYGGLTAAVALEDRVLVQKYVPAPGVRCVVLIPDYELPTSRARQKVPRSVPVRDAVFNLARIPFVLAKITSGELNELSLVMDDRLHQPYRKALVRGYESIVSESESAGAAAVCLSGAGPAMIAFCSEHSAPRVAKAMQEVMRAICAGCQVVLCAPDNSGARLVEQG